MKSKAKEMSLKKVLQFISEAGTLKRLPRSGWNVVGIKNGETVAEHSFRCAVIGYVLARMEEASVHKVLLMTLFGDIQEARITDLHKMAQKYLNVQSAEDKCFYDQIRSLPHNTRDPLQQMYNEYRRQKTKESIIARDADILECLIQAKEYYEQGHCKAALLMKKAPRFLKTKSAQKLWKLAKSTNFSDWWFKLSEFKR
ncbi:MAG: HD domain-containing protein [Candidatus Omnitrophota bacterium]|nr:MAG: HD domain-containing protein [Candidatus Omnitrophota bacterium]